MLLLGKLQGYLIGAAVLTALVLGFVLYIHHLQAQVQKARYAQAAAEAQATTASAQLTTSAKAAAIIDTGAHRDAITVTLHEAHTHAIDAAQGAAAPLDPALNAAGRRGLCQYDAYRADPGCAGLLGPDPHQLPNPGGADTTPPF